MSLGLISLLISNAFAVPLSSVPAGGLVISEIMHNPDASADYRGEYIEIYNAHTDTVDLNGLVVTSSGEAGFTVSQTVNVAAGDYAVLAVSGAISFNGGNTEVDYEYAYTSLKLNGVETLTLSSGGTTFDTMSYNSNSHPLEAGAALILNSSSLTASGNDNAANWCTSSTAYGFGDFGTPGAANDGCNTLADLAPGDLIISEVMMDPTKVADYRGEWIEIYNTTTTNYNLNGLQVTSTGNSGFTVSESITIPGEGRVVLATRLLPSSNGGFSPDGVYSYGDVSLVVEDTVTLSAGGTTLDSVTWQRWSPHWPGTLEPGYSMSLSPSLYDGTANDSHDSWCLGSSTYGDGDFGTPGEPNDVCPNVDGDGDGFIASEDCDDTDANVTVNTYYLDNDSDTYGDPSSTVTGCTVPTGYVEVAGDCNDTNSSINPDAIEECDSVDNDCDGDIDDSDADLDTSTASTWYPDSDNDSYGDEDAGVMQCEAPTSFISVGGDCDDSDAGINPGATDIELNGIDENCDGVDNTGTDNDGDGFTVSQGDCNDNDASINPNATETCDGVDNDCDTLIDDADTGVTGTTDYFFDNDSDGFAGSSSVAACTQPSGTFVTSTDCDDSDASVFPNATEIIDDGIDQNCDSGDLCYVDADDDGFRTESTTASADLDCLDSGEGESSDTLDCDDTSSSVNPNAIEVCDSLDNDCDGDIDDSDSSVDTSTGTIFYADSDDDLYGDANNTVQTCARPAGYVTNALDCDDTNNQIKPVDGDGDGVDRCNNDCDDNDEFSYPGAAETESATDCMTDADSDGYGDTTAPSGGVSGTDCDDSEAAANPGADEICDGIDNDCDNDIDDADSSVTDATTWYADSDNDTFGDSSNTSVSCSQPSGFVSDDSDCDDASSAVNPNATETCDGIDNDCDNLIDDDDTGVTGTTTFFADGDSDGFGDSSNTSDACSQPTGFVTDNTDCDDSSSAAFPGATEVCDSIDNDCDTEIDEGTGGNTFYLDSDNDGFGDSTQTTDSCEQPTGYVADNTDCNDSDASVFPGAAEVCLDGVDSDCDNTDSLGACDGTVADDDFTITGVGSGDRLGQAISYAGNVTGDTTNDFVLGSRWNGSEAGAVYVFAGSPSLSGSASASTADVTITGSGSERFGFSVAGGTSMLGGINGDFNGDGNDDLLIGAPNADVEGSAIGAAYMFYGPLSADTTSASADVVFTGQFGQDPTTPSNHNAVNTGYSVAFVGDINNDGIGDIAIGDPSKKNSGATNGEAYLIFGRADTFDGDGTQLTGQYEGTVSLNEVTWRSTLGREIKSEGTSREQMGGAIDAIGDVNGDGIDDLAIGAYRWDQSSSNVNQNNGAVFVWYGGGSLYSQNLVDGDGNATNNPLLVSHNASNHTADVTILGPSAGDAIGRSLSGAGDFDGDGNLDIIVGSEHAGSNAGMAMIVNGSGTTIATFTGESAGDAAGRWVSSLGDVNGDGRSEVLVGAKLADANGTDSGATYIVLGGASGTNSLGTAEVFLTGAGAGNETGMNLSGLDDMDGDGISEILIGSYRTSSDSGAVQLIFGSTFQ